MIKSICYSLLLIIFSNSPILATDENLEIEIRKENVLPKYYFDSEEEFGKLRFYFNEEGITSSELVDDFIENELIYNNELGEFYRDIIINKRGKLVLFSQATNFQIDVWLNLIYSEQKITTYGEFASMMGKPNHTRAIARAIASNNFAYIVPCHRVVGANGKLKGFKWGIEKKERLLKYMLKNMK